MAYDLSTYAGRQQARDEAAAAGRNVVVDAQGIYDRNTGQTSSGNASFGGGGTAATVTTGGGVTKADLDAQFQRMLAALASGNKEAFEFEKTKFNQQFNESKRQFDLGRSDALSQFEQSFGLKQGELTGMYNGQPTEAARQFNQRLQSDLGTSLLNAATQIRGPRDYLQYQTLTRGGQNLMQQLMGNQAAGFQPNTGGPATLQSVLADLGIGAPAGAPAAAGADPQAQLLQRFGITAGQQLNPNQVNPARWDAMGQIGRDLTKNLAETVYGYDPTDFESLINATRPLGQAARQTTYGYRQPTGLF